MAVNLSNTVFSWIANLLKGEQRTGTLERLLVSVQFPASLFVGRAMAHMLFMSIFVTVTLGLVSIWVRPDFDIDPVAATIVVILHLAAVYGMAFALSAP
jgi:ABC-type transport system involved in cytochrome c biogenesis permease component